MKKLVLVTITFLFFILSGANDSAPPPASTPTRTTGPLQIFYDGQHSSVITKIIRETTEGLGKFKHQVFPVIRSGRQVASFEKNKITTPVFNIRYSILARSGTRYRRASSFRGKKLAIIRGISSPELSKFIKSEKIVVKEVNNYRDGIHAVECGRVEGLIGMELKILSHLRNKSEAFSIIGLSSVLPGYNLYLSFAKTFPAELHKVVEDRLFAMKESGKLNEFIKSLP